MSIMDDYKQLRMIENVKRFKEMEIAYTNLKLVKKQEQQINKLATCIEEIKEIAENCSFTDNIQLLLNRFEQILQKISEVKNV